MIVRVDLKKVFDNFYSKKEHSHNETSITYANVLNTTSKTLSGAINEHEEEINNLQEHINKIIADSIPDGNIISEDQEYVLIKEIDTDFIISSTIEINSVSSDGKISLGAIQSLPNDSAIDNIAGINVQVNIDNGEIYTHFDTFNNDSHIELVYDIEYRFTLEKCGSKYIGTIYDLTNDNLILTENITNNNANFKYIVLWGTGDVDFYYRDVLLNASHLLKTKNQTIIGAINELYDDQEYIWTTLIDRINAL